MRHPMFPARKEFYDCEVHMKVLGIFTTLVLLLFLFNAAPGRAQEQDENKPDHPQAQRPRDNQKPPDMERQDQRQQEQEQRKEQKQDEKTSRQEQNSRPENQRPQEQRKGQHNAEMDRNQHGHPAANRGKHIPDNDFRAHFGRQHTFHVQRSQVINVSQPIIVFSGYSFELVDPWPAEWSFDDDCYIDEIDNNYFLFDEMHPGMQIAVFIVE
jgi:hypothetical protein